MNNIKCNNKIAHLHSNAKPNNFQHHKITNLTNHYS